jgi:hypothetical protein
MLADASGATDTYQTDKSFLVLFFKKELLPYYSALIRFATPISGGRAIRP